MIGDYVLLKQRKESKLTTAFEPAFYVIYKIERSTIHARRVHDNREITRDASKFKIANQVVQNMRDEEDDEIQKNWREKLLLEWRKATPGPPQEIPTRKIPPTGEAQTIQVPESEETLIVQIPPHEMQTTEPRVRSQRTRKKPEKLKDYIMCVFCT